MKINIIRKEYFSFLLLIFSLVIVSLISCSEQETEKSTSDHDAESYPEHAVETAAAESYPEHAEETAATNGSDQSGDSKSNKFDEYIVVLGVDEQMEIPGFPGELRVWIGSSSFKPNFPTRMVQDKTTIPAEGESAKIEPFAPAFKVEPKETQCIKIHRSGSEVRFKLIPQKSGTFEVGANVYLFDSLDCSGSPIPKTAATLKVMVEVNQKEILLEKAKELWNVFWEKLLEFWAVLVALIFGLILFLIRGKLRQWFGYEND